MGNAESNVTSGVKNQAGPSVQALYKLVDVKGKRDRVSDPVFNQNRKCA